MQQQQQAGMQIRGGSVDMNRGRGLHQLTNFILWLTGYAEEEEEDIYLTHKTTMRKPSRYVTIHLGQLSLYCVKDVISCSMCVIL